MAVHRWVVAAVIVAASGWSTTAGYGDPDDAYPTHPSWQERAIHVLTDACRMAPQEFRDAYVGNSTILLESNYPAVGPLYWNLQLNRVARLHAIDMADNCGLNHNSCDGTPTFTRIRRYYTASPNMGENIAYSRSNPLSTMLQWILDGPLSNPAPDRSSGDGHRRNIMNGNYHELGAGFATGPQGYRDVNPYWVQDFGGGRSDYAGRPLPSASHVFIDNGMTTFMVSYFDAGGEGPSAVRLVLEGEEHEVPLALGAAARGTYILTLPTAQDCRSYFFTAIDSEGEEWRYPEEGFLLSYGEGACSESYASSVVRTRGRGPAGPPATRRGGAKHGIGSLRASPGNGAVLLDVRGRAVRLHGNGRCAPGVYFSVRTAEYGAGTVERPVVIESK